MDKWKDMELEKMKVGGNRKAQDFFETQPDYKKTMSLVDKYNTKAAALYRDKVRQWIVHVCVLCVQLKTWTVWFVSNVFVKSLPIFNCGYWSAGKAHLHSMLTGLHTGHSPIYIYITY